MTSYKLSSAVFGGRQGRRLGIAFRLSRRATVRVAITRGGTRTVRTFRARRYAPDRTHRLSLRSAGLRRGRLPRDAARRPAATDLGGPAPALISCRAMSPETTAVETDQAAREATGAHPYGRYLEEFEVGAVYKHWPAKTVTEADDHLFCLITMNHHPLHINDVYAGQSQQGRNVVVGPLVYSLALGMSVSDVSGKAIANLATEELKHPAPVFHGDTLFCESEVLEVKESRSKTDRGTVRSTPACSTRTACSSPSSSGSCSCRAARRARRRPRATWSDLGLFRRLVHRLRGGAPRRAPLRPAA